MALLLPLLLVLGFPGSVMAQRDGAGAADPTAFQRPPEAPPTPAELRRGRQALTYVTVKDTAARYRALEHVTFGVPLARGELTDLEPLRVWDAASSEALPCQARALSHWPDGSVRWVLIDTRVQLQAREARRLAIGHAPNIAADKASWRRHQNDDGTLVLDDGKTAWPLFSPGEGGGRILGLDAQLVDIFGHEYRAEVDPQSLEVLERGPLRAVIRMRGAHRALVPHVDGGGLPIDFYTFTVHVHLLAGLRTARVEWTLENTPLVDPPGALAFDSYVLRLHPGGPVSGVAVGTRSLDADTSFTMEQGGEGTRVEIDGQRATGMKIGDLWAGLLTGEATGTGTDRVAKSGVFVRMVDSAENHPSRISHEKGGPLLLEQLPSGMGETFFLDDASRKTFRLDLVVEPRSAAGRALMSQAERSAHVALVPSEVLASGAWGDAGLIYLPEAPSLKRAPSPPRKPPTGWADWGESQATNTHQSGSPRNKLSVFLEAMESGNPDVYRWNVARAQHAMDMRPYHIAGFLASEYPWANLYEGTPHGNNKTEHSLNRKGMRNRYKEYKAEIPRGGHGYNGFDPEHMTLDDVYEYYLLTGSWLAKDALQSAGEAMLTWKEIVSDGYIHSSRTFGWTLRALVQVYRATGEERYIEAARRYVARADAERGKGDVKYLRRMKPDPQHLATQYYDAPFMVAVALYGLSAYWAETEDPIVPPMAADLVDFCMSAYREGGFMPDMPTDNVWTGGEPSSPLGVTTWVPGAIAAGAYITGDHEPVDVILPYYALLRSHTSNPVSFGASDWHWWQPYLASLRDRHGDIAVIDPKGFLDSLGSDR